ncbi:preprotein translocase subunit SecD [Alkalihalobacillus alcalophilus ATCC 27647 = CGMCC 1.3604]|uniref:Protein translocase subunit SecD n=1 Tax=Alkalihalobacillus alcalophilus ATCC 27647 = CGMCC 1.3604 TaxID=1218173 RepID=A0A4S4K095_ALKAL|nr:protein translocase subunit SecD [Alkalihalobacillus alcalophilus]MED1561567.1 protein translocase subunit SecD [Alkalihalobacillus alcalophilus]THG90550.1 preprotein translocase subunit SecD [Alkalihalobacillus alcalophilus ATCC 27647 = CGMCC 1.3604]
MVKKGRIVAFFLILAAIAVLISTTVMDITKDVKLGLDLQGGFEILYEVEPANEGDVINHEALTATVAALNQRINVIGVSEPNIQIEGDNRIRVQLAGVENQQQAREMLSTEAVLTIRDVDDNILLDGADLAQNGASVGFSERTGSPVVQITLRDGNFFGDVTREIASKPLGENLMVIWLDFEEGDSYYGEAMKEEPKFLSAATVGEEFRTTTVQIEGTFSLDEAQNLSELLNAGSLPVSLTEIYSNSVGASLGEQAMEKTIYAGFIGVALILIYMIVYYRFMGVIAAITLTAYIYLVLLVFNLMNAVLTLPGIAALILGVGMAVDANILTYERIKEEIRAGKSIMSAYKAGSKRAFTTILDANLTTLLAAGVMFVYGTSSVQGFAVMLIVGILVSFVTAVYGARLMLGLWVNSKALNKKYWLFGVKEDQIDEL